MLHSPSGLIYTIKGNGTLSIIGYRGGSPRLVIPDEIDGYPVVSIGDYAFSECSGLRTLVLPGSLRDIGDHAFENCTGLMTITFPEELDVSRLWPVFRSATSPSASSKRS
ncbi:MAG: leucine-rich repeat protein [Spirochaetaceae bacterium]